MRNLEKASSELHFNSREHARSVYQLAHQWHPKALKAQWVLLLTWLSMYALSPWVVPGLMDVLGPLGGITANTSASGVASAFMGLLSYSAWPEWAQLVIPVPLAAVVFGAAFLTVNSFLVLFATTIAEAFVANDFREGGEMPTEKFTDFVSGHVGKYRFDTSFFSASPTILILALTGSLAMAALVFVATLYSISVQRNALNDIQARAVAPC